MLAVCSAGIVRGHVLRPVKHFTASGRVAIVPKSVIIGHCYPPLCHRTAGIAFGHIFKGPPALFILKRVQQGNSPLEGGLHFRRTRSFKVNGTYFLLSKRMMMFIRPHATYTSHKNAQQRYKNSHMTSALITPAW